MKNYDYKDETKDVKGKVSPRQKSRLHRNEWIDFNFTSIKSKLSNFHLNVCRLKDSMQFRNSNKCSRTRKM